MKKPSLSVVIPSYNEMRTIGSVIEIVRSWGKTREIIVVDDGSTDKTREVVGEFGASVRLISNAKNLGKSEAMRKGIAIASGEFIMFLDGDLLGLTHRALDALIAPAYAGGADMVVGVRGTGHPLSKQFRAFGGERVLRRSDVVALFPKMRKAGYGVEVVFNEAYKDRKIAYVHLPYVSHQIKLEKWPLGRAVASYVREGVEVIPRHIWHLFRS